MKTPFGKILRDAVEQTPGAVGGALAAGDGELVDSWTSWDELEWAILTAHYGILVQHIRSALHTFHYGDVEFLFLEYDKLCILVEVVSHNYYAILAVVPPVDLPVTSKVLHEAALLLQEEML